MLSLVPPRDERIVDWGYVDFLLDNLYKLDTSFRIRRSIELMVTDEANVSPPKTLHLITRVQLDPQVEDRLERGVLRKDIQTNYYGLSGQILDPHIELKPHLIGFLKFLQKYHGPRNVLEIMRRPQAIRSKLEQTPEITEAARFKYWSPEAEYADFE